MGTTSQEEAVSESELTVLVLESQSHVEDRAETGPGVSQNYTVGREE